ncbi:DUF6555 family protein [Pseudomonas coleopterorum]
MANAWHHATTGAAIGQVCKYRLDPARKPSTPRTDKAGY